MSEYTHRTIILPAAFQQLAQALCEAAADGDAGKGMLTTGLSETGTEPATHYISAGYIEDTFADILPLTTITPAAEMDEPPTVETRPGNVEFVEGIAAQAGITLPAGTIAALFDAISVGEEDAYAAMDRLGLQFITEPIAGE